MNEITALTIIIVTVMGLYLLGHNLIDAYFRRKERFVDNLQDKLGKGNSNGSIE